MTVLKTFFKNESPKVISYRNYNLFSNDLFCTDLINEISINGILEGDLTGFFDACKSRYTVKLSGKRNILGQIKQIKTKTLVKK